MNPNYCGDCGDEDDTRYMECCGIFLCEDCADRHEAKWGKADEPIPYTVTPAGKAALEGGE